jgi:ABC-type sugar transport system ATPase subunit
MIYCAGPVYGGRASASPSTRSIVRDPKVGTCLTRPLNLDILSVAAKIEDPAQLKNNARHVDLCADQVGAMTLASLHVVLLTRHQRRVGTPLELRRRPRDLSPGSWYLP